MPARAVTRGEAVSTGEQRAYWFWADLVIVHVSGDETGGRFSLVEFLMPPDDMTPLHVHRRESQTVYVLEGEVTIWWPGVSRVLRSGECIHQPACVPQTERVTSAEPARVLDIGLPAGFERFIAAAGEPAAELTLPPLERPLPDLERFAALADEHAIELLGPPGSLP
jgi:mannose-6-phosphate isomerase-like protein (cupin superfamily)